MKNMKFINFLKDSNLLMAEETGSPARRSIKKMLIEEQPSQISRVDADLIFKKLTGNTKRIVVK